MSNIEIKDQPQLIGQERSIEKHNIRIPSSGLGDICPSELGKIFDVLRDGQVLVFCEGDACIYKEVQEGQIPQQANN